MFNRIGTFANNGLRFRIFSAVMNDLIVIPEGVEGSATNVYYKTSNGINWSSGTLPYSQIWNAIVKFKNKISIFSSPSNKIYTSSDLINFSEISSISSPSFYRVAKSSNTAVALNFDRVIYSNDGSIWSASSITPGQFNSYSSIAYGNDKFILSPLSSNIAKISTTGYSSWTDVVLPNSADTGSLAFGNNTFIMTARDPAVIGFG